MEVQRKGMFDLSLIPGVVGMVLMIIGTQQPLATQGIYFVYGSILMLLPAIAKKHVFFIGLQVIAAVGAISAFLPVVKSMQASLPITVTFAFLVWLTVTKRLNDWLDYLGMISIMILAIGYAMSTPVIYLCGGICLIFYSAASIKRGVKISWLWLILNVAFSISAASAIYKFHQ